MDNPRILILGAGPTGLGAAHRLNEFGYSNWILCEKAPVAGGLAGSIVDAKGFTWDLGGHVQFSHYDYFDDLMDSLLGKDGWLHHQRESWVWIRDRFVPYPFQMNLHRLPPADIERCLSGLLKAQDAPVTSPGNFGQWIDATFGEGIASLFMRPYNFKVWAYPPEALNKTWIGDRVATIDLDRVRRNIDTGSDDLSWGPNKTFRFPKHGGTGSIWRECASRLPSDKMRYNVAATSIDSLKQKVSFSDGSVLPYDKLLSTVPLANFLAMSDLPDLATRAAGLKYSSTHIFGIGLKGQPPPEMATKCWMYFPEYNCPFYRVTVFSNYSPENVPDSRRYWSLMAEVSESPMKPVSPPSVLLEEVIQGMLNTNLIQNRDAIVNTWQTRLEHGYPTPSLDRDAIIYDILPALDRINIGSRGRFGAWRYEVSNQDHSLMQGVEWVNKTISGEDEITVWHPDKVNAPRQGR